ncbi:peptidoglycan/LPS O-acetylase OafA/YrhL [Ochrobactrum sp. BH3]|nr:peptidoglycan/LPS O-acetylase OafA/YrhL [Ochrobactrum sp. BH3]
MSQQIAFDEKHDVARVLTLDGLRGLAILLVIVFHLTLVYPFAEAEKSFFYMSGGIGWIGVDLFFVLSGFLITGILIDAKGKQNYFKNFFARRTLRIFPIYYFVLFIVFIIMPMLGMFYTPELTFVKSHQFYLWTYLTNWGFVDAGGARYFNTGWLTLVHFWSLAVEEQFYIFWPFVVYFLSKRAFVKFCVFLFIFALVGRFAIAIFGIPQGAAYTLTPFRIDTLVVGALIAVAVRNPAARQLVAKYAVWPLVFATAFLAFVFAVHDGVWFADRWMHTIGFSILALGWGGLLVMCLPGYGNGILDTLFQLPLLRFFGKYSYGLYVLHPFVLEQYSPRIFSELEIPETIAATVYIIVGIGLSVIPAWISWHLLEKRFLGLKRFFEDKKRIETPAGFVPDTRIAERTPV